MGKVWEIGKKSLRLAKEPIIFPKEFFYSSKMLFMVRKRGHNISLNENIADGVFLKLPERFSER